jgi:two-component system cell cycle response regulator
MDVEMPKMNGFEACKKLRTNKTTCNIPIVMVTGLASKSELERGFEAGVAEYFVKPFAKGDLYNYVHRLFSGREAEKFAKAVIGCQDKNSANIIRMALEKNGFDISEYENAMQLLGVLDEETDLLLLDESVKGLNPYELTNLIRKQKEFEHIPIVYITDKGDPLKLVKALDMGANDYLQKPFWDRELIARAHALVKTKRLFDVVQSQKKILETLAITDKLTGLYNRHFLEDVMEKEFSSSVRHNRPLSLAFLDVDHFKKMNDTHGHQNGDLVLEHLGKLLQKSFRVSDVKARYGGEEFVVLMPETIVERAVAKMEKFRQSIEKYLIPSLDGQTQLQFTVSIGISGTEHEIQNKEDLLKFADDSLYKSKKNGRNRITVYQSAAWPQPE